MRQWIRKHPGAAFLTGLVFLVLLFLLYRMRMQNINNAAEMTLRDEPRNAGAVSSDFYSMQLTGRESETYRLFRQRLEEKKGGVVEFPEALSGTEYLRVTTALEDEGYNYFYGFFDIPMSEEDVYLKYKGADLANIKDRVIVKAILFLSCAEGIDVFGEYAGDGKVRNLSEVEEAFSVNLETEEEKIQAVSQKTEEVLEEIVNGLPKEYGEKRTADYFLNWLDNNLSFTTGAEEDASSYTSMKEVFDGIYLCNNLSAVTEKKATALGYAKILSALLNRAGMESHIVLGTWGRSRFQGEGYVLTAVQMNNQTVYIDASGAKSAELGGQRYLREQEAKNHMKFVEYFDYAS